MAFLLEGETDETLAAAFAFLDEQQKLSTSLKEPLEDSPTLPSLDDPEAADVLDDLSAELPATADKAIKSISWTAANPTPKLLSQLRFNRRQVKKPYVRKKPLSYNPNKARDERKLELVYLRQKVTDMEMELLKLQEIKEATNPDSHSTNDAVPRVWEKMCARQLQRRVKAERENARLKVVLEGQIKIAKSMEQILKKRTVLRAMESCGSNKRTKHTNRRPEPRADAKIFEILLAGVEASYREVDAVFEANGLGRTEAPKSDTQMRDGVNGMYLEIFANKMIPFGMHATGQAVWQHFKGTDIPYRWFHSKSAGSIESTEDTMVECFDMDMYDAKSKTTAEFNVKQILRRYVEEDRVVIVWRSHIDPLEFSNKRFAGIHFEEKGYVVIKPRAHSEDSSGDHDDFTLLQTCYIITPDLSDQSLNDDAKTGALTEFVMSSTAANISASHEMIENVLLDQALQQRKRQE
ncbi:M96 mating-specific protein family [Phytophthora infestans T30-4]|uniref:M96 mating-specific protein family n=1 Tax=Phytophthora infestans (strain T30-4) TaxID=403677 RepID=D0NTH9_PHYIT|nr:M96 mating-specific protein family [Phytophthora infestans T30-4]EEY64930.1 M96 mating-specific protein family [Phytophthora infestans T30-4]|eukprot:XP_002897660.1 M96 mating-specific protein family [Phytophthora infestans T30-4]